MIENLSARKVVLFCFLSMFHLASLAQTREELHATAPWVGETLNGTSCQRQLSGGVGPYDYNLRSSTLKRHIDIVEKAHFQPEVENLIVGGEMKMYRSIIGNLKYTLHACPNHHRALNAYTRATFDYRSEQVLKNKEFPAAECFLQRAINYTPGDATVRMLYGIFLQRSNHPEEALKFYRSAEGLAPNDLQIKYNIGLVLIDLGKYELATDYAEIVYSANFPLKGLRRQLADNGYTVETAPAN